MANRIASQVALGDTTFVGRRPIELVISRVSAADIQFGLANLKSVLDMGREYHGRDSLLLHLKDPAISSASKLIALFINRSWRMWGETSTVDSVAALRDLLWLRSRLSALLLDSAASRRSLVEPTAFLAGTDSLASGRDVAQDGIALLPKLSDGLLIQLAYEAFYLRGCTASEIFHWGQKLESGLLGRDELLRSMFTDYAKAATEAESGSLQTNNPYVFRVMGTGQLVTLGDWQAKEDEIASAQPGPADPPIIHSRFYIKHTPTLLITAIASLYRGGKFIEQFMDNITSQTCFSDYCELIIVDADSPENESEVINRFCGQHKNIVYHRVNHRIGIYEAWNVAVKLARGEYLTNTNLDDLRRGDSIELQAAVLDNLPFVDVVYQDFYYTFDIGLTFQEIARFRYRSNLPVITAHNLMHFNSPHNAPMWRKKLHDEYGLFDPSYKSAGDYEFWVRCLAEKRVFYKINDPHVAYYQNPEGLSTRPDTRGVDEARRILKTYARRLITRDAVDVLERLIRQNPTQVDESPYTRVQSALRNTAASSKYAAEIAKSNGTEATH
jgi:glycosyltransferase involved in cell wall biosynthesis